MRMPSVLVHAQILLLCVCLALRGQTPAAPSPAAKSRTVRIGGTHGKPAYSLRIFAKGSQGVIEVRDASAVNVQTLTCPLLGDVPEPTKDELDGLSEPFLHFFETADLNFDGYQDIQALREHGAKWGVYCVWLFDPQQQLFVKDRLAGEMELLSNLEADPKTRRIASYSIGPTDPLRDEYRVETPHEGRPYWSRLIPVQSCFLKTGLQPSDRIAILTEYQGGRAIIRRGAMPPEIESTCGNLCECVRKAVEQPKGPVIPRKVPGR